MKRRPSLPAPPTPLDHPDPVDDQAMKQYLRGVECRRLVFARELDESPHWQACEAEDVKCDLCESDGAKVGDQSKREHEQDVEHPHNGAEQGGPVRYQRQQMEEQYQPDEYLRRLSVVYGSCILCRTLAPRAAWTHPLDTCPRAQKWEFIQCKNAARHRSAKGKLISDYAACCLCCLRRCARSGGGKGIG